MISRRHFLRTLAIAAASPAAAIARDKSSPTLGFGELIPDPEGVIDLPAGFSYTIISRQGEEMDDGLLVPAKHDGMAAFRGENNTLRIVCNHENYISQQRDGAFGANQERLSLVDRNKVYDYGNGSSPGTGGTTTIHYDPSTRERLSIHLSLGGTEINCAGGPMPWGSWLSCEETFRDPGSSFERGRIVQREKRHGYIFEVPAHGDGLAEPVPLTEMGRFEHEAAAANPASGVIYLTEDRHRSLLYRFIPNKPGVLREGGRLQALAITGKPGFDTRNWDSPMLNPGMWLDTEWVDLENPDGHDNDLRLRGREIGAAIFARGEGICYADGDLVFTCTIGGPARLGQVFAYRPSPAEATPGEAATPGKLSLVAESSADSLLRNGDNLTLSPWGDLLVCEDTSSHCGLIGIRPDGQQYAVANNVYTRAELAGVCFSPDGKVMLLNIQQRGLMLAITGPWSTPS
jgi:secreted PhoX family phosphatase